MTESTTPAPPNLDDSIRQLKEVSQDVSQSHPKKIAELYVAAIGLLCHLKVDQQTIFRVRHEERNSATLSTSEQIPAVHAVLQDGTLFRALLRCLQLPYNSDAESSDGNGSSTAAPNLLAGRKRSSSVINEPPENRGTKMLKTMHSPVPTVRNKVYTASQPTFNLAQLISTILYMALMHLDHWPAPLIRAYADDCFGPRLWVDDEGCRMLVQNLALVHIDVYATETSDQMKKDASSVAEAYRNFSLTSVHTTPNGKTKHLASSHEVERGGISSIKIGRDRSMSMTFEMEANELPIEEHSSSADEHNCILNSVRRVRSGEDSSSGEEDEEVLTTTGSQDSNSQGGESRLNTPSVLLFSSNGSSKTSEKLRPRLEIELYPKVFSNVILEPIRQRFFDANLDLAHEFVCQSLSERLEMKSKQNSSLLQTLPSFATIPGVRRQIASNLEKWLQSPALAGLSRTLFAATVQLMRNLDPPLPDDIEAINSILEMKLKANQINAHVENITAIASRIPTATVVNHMYSKILGEMNLAQHNGSSTSDQLKMIAAIHKVVNPQVSYEAMAASLLMMLVAPSDEISNQDEQIRTRRERVVKMLRSLLRSIATELGRSFDGYALLDALLSFDVDVQVWSIKEEEDKARLLLQCVTLLVAPFVPEHLSTRLQQSPVDEITIDKAVVSLRKSLKAVRMLLLSWCCSDYGPRIRERLDRKQNRTEETNGCVGAGPPDYSSILNSQDSLKIPAWLRLMRCLLFIEEPDSPIMKQFVCPLEDPSLPANNTDWGIELERIKLCCIYGNEVDDDIIWIVVKSATSKQNGVSADMALQLLEHLFECCTTRRRGNMKITDPMLVWEMYALVQYQPHRSLEGNGANKMRIFEDHEISSDHIDSQYPRLALPGHWWRVTMLALVMCAASPDNLGTVLWKDHPTLRSLIKMVTSLRYRFPTVDCDERMRDETKNAEQSARGEENRIAELLFLPPKVGQKISNKSGSRVSKRLQKQQQEKIASLELVEASKRKASLRIAQKSIMLWDPDGPARKPPRESADLLLSIEKMFQISDTFQRSVKPDFLLMTIGETTRGAIERAYEWLIPIISRLPDTIARLPSNAACFLLLRAYGTEGEERVQLKELSSPLLDHVKGSLKGSFGELDAIRALDLLLSDVASPKPERRKCARRVLQDSLVNTESDGHASKSWIANILSLSYAKALVSYSIKHMTMAADCERGSVLRMLVIGLHDHMQFATAQDVATVSGFPPILLHLISSRPTIYADVLDAFRDLRCLAVRVLHEECSRLARRRQLTAMQSNTSEVNITLYPTPIGEGAVCVSLDLLKSVCVLLSIWREDNVSKVKEDDDVRVLVTNLMNAFTRPSRDENKNAIETAGGLASAKMFGTSIDAVKVESWILLAKSRSDLIARRAAMSAPDEFLPRLLLCSGLPKASLLTMLNRLGRLGDSAQNSVLLYRSLLTPSASSEWDIGRVGRRRDISRKLLGRLSAYIRLNNIDLGLDPLKVSRTFLDWLSAECSTNASKACKAKPKNLKTENPRLLSRVGERSPSLTEIGARSVGNHAEMESNIESEDLHFINFKKWSPPKVSQSDHSRSDASFVKAEFLSQSSNDWDERLCALEPKDRCFKAVQMLDVYARIAHPKSCATSAVLKWVPRLSRDATDEKLWKHIFCSSKFENQTFQRLVSQCVACWSQRNVQECSRWILKKVKDANPEEFCYDRIVSFFVLVFEKSLLTFTEVEASSFPGVSESDFAVMLQVIIGGLEGESEDSFTHASEPLSFRLLLQLVKGGQSVQFAADFILGGLDSGSNSNHMVGNTLLLRLYIAHPYGINLGPSSVRGALLEASEMHVSEWECWSSNTDDQIEEMINSLFIGESKISKCLANVARKHPLLFFRKSPFIISRLWRDAQVDDCPGSNIRGLVRGKHPGEPLEANLPHAGMVSVVVRHWGYKYTEPVWMALLDIISGVPTEVLFGSGHRLGLTNILGVYVQLVSVQQRLRSADKLSRLKSKLQDCFNAFQKSNKSDWNRWLGTGAMGDEMRNLLVACDFISPQQAIESLKGED